MAKEKYSTLVKPKLKEIKELVESGYTNDEIIQVLNISKKSFYTYVSKYKELADILDGGRAGKIKRLKQTLYARAIGGTKVTKEEYALNKETGEMELVEQVIKDDPGSMQALMILLKNWDKFDDGKTKWSDDPAAIELKREELKLKEKIAKENNW